MAIDKKDKPISAAPVAIATPVKVGADNNRAVAQLKGPTEVSRLRAETVTAEPPKQSEQDVAFQRFIQLALIERNKDDLLSMIDDSDLGLEDNFDPKDPIDQAYAEFRKANSSDRQATAAYETSVQNPFIYNPRIPSQAGGERRNNQFSIIDDGFKIPTYKLDKQQARTTLAADIKTVSEMYAKEAGMSAKDFASVMAGIATIESRFGVARSVTGTKYESSAGGAFHYLNGTIAGEVRKSMSDPRIAGRVSALGVSIGDGVSKSEAWTLKDDNILAGSILAKRIVETANANPELRNDVAALATRVYQAHNLGDAGARALANGGKQALDSLDYKAAANNPMFFAGTQSDAEINGRYQKFVAGAISSSQALIQTAFASGPQSTVVAAASHKADLRDPAPRPA